MSLRLRVQNVLGIVAADLPLDGGITLLAGANGAGKSSLLNACAAAALRVWKLRGAAQRAQGATVVRAGCDTGTASLDWGTGAIRVSWPSLAIDQTGDGSLKQFGTAAAIGAVRWMDAEPRFRMADLGERLATAPTEADILAWLEKKGVSNAAEIAPLMAEKTTVSGWDAVHKSAQEQGVKLKGRWEQVASVKWGEQRAKSWAPDGLLHGEAYTLEAAEADVVTAKAEVERLVKEGAVSEAELRATEARAATAPGLRDDVARLRAEGAELSAALRRVTEQRDALPAPPGDGAVPCPHCGKPLHLGRRGAVLAAVDVVLPTAEETAARAGLDRAIADIRAQITANAEALTNTIWQSDRANAAEQKVEEQRRAPRADTQAIATAQTHAARMEARRDAVRSYLTAHGIHALWLEQQPLIEALSPAGVRQSVLGQKLAAFNEELAALSTIARWGAVSMNDEADPAYDGRAYPLLSESERWRVDLTLQVAFAMREGAGLLLVDRLDVLTPTLRPGVMQILRHAGIPSIVAMTRPEQDGLVDLSKAGLGRTAWVEAGVVRLI